MLDVLMYLTVRLFVSIAIKLATGVLLYPFASSYRSTVIVKMTTMRNAAIFSTIVSMALLHPSTEINAFVPVLRTTTTTRSSWKYDITNIRRDHSMLPPPVSTTTTTATTQLHMIANIPSDDGSGLSYAERSRPYRRDVFDSDEWLRVRSTTRFSKNLLSIFQSGVVRQLLNEAIFIAGVATFLCLYNALLVTGYDDFNGIHHDPFGQGFYVFKLPSIFFTLTSPALSLLLGM
jgi:hypothetical protein